MSDQTNSLLLLKYCRENQFQLAKEIISDPNININITSKQDNGATPLTYALMHQNKDLVSLLLQYGANVNTAVNTGDNNVYPVHLCAMTDFNKEIFDLLYLNKADFNALDGSGWTPLMVAVFDSKVETVKYLLEKKVNVDVKDKEMMQNVLHMCTKGTDVRSALQVAKLLCEYDLSLLESIDKNGNTPLHLACQYENKEMAGLLIDYGPHVMNKKNFSGLAPFQLCTDSQIAKEMFYRAKEAERIKRLIEIHTKPLMEEIQKLKKENQYLLSKLNM